MSDNPLCIPPLQFLVMALRDRYSGTAVARVQGGNDEHVLLFHKGAPANLRLAAEVITLRSVVLHMGLVDEQTLDACVEFAQSNRLLLGGILVARGVVTASALEDALRVQLQQKVAHLLELAPRMEFRLHAGVNLLQEYGGPEGTAIEPVGMLLYGARLAASTDVVESQAAALDGVSLVLHPGVQVGKLRVRGDEDQALRALLEAPQTIASLVERGLDPRSVKNLIFALHAARLVTDANAAPAGLASLPPGGRSVAPTGISIAPAGAAARLAIRRSRRSREELAQRKGHEPRVSGAPQSLRSHPSRPSGAASIDSLTPSPPPGGSDPMPDSSVPISSNPPRDSVPSSRSMAPRARPSSPRTTTSHAEYFRRASHALRLLDFDGADRAIREALAQVPNDPDYAATKVFIDTSRSGGIPIADGVAKLGKLIGAHPKCELAYYHRARLYKADRRMDEAYADFEKCVELNPSNLHAADELKAKRKATPEIRSRNSQPGRSVLDWLKKDRS